MSLLLLPSFPSAHRTYTRTQYLGSWSKFHKQLCMAQGMRYIRTPACSSQVDDQITTKSIRSAKSASDWTDKELCAYNITVVPQTKKQFFGSTKLPAPMNPSISGFMKVEYRGGAEDEADEETRKLLQYLELAIGPECGLSGMDNFVSKLLEKMGYGAEGRIIFIRRTLPFVICGTTSLAQPDVCVMNDNKILLLVQEDKCRQPEPQVIAEAIAAFAFNNKLRGKHNFQPRNRAVIPAITMTGTYPVFYKIPVTTQLNQAVRGGFYPPTKTHVHCFSPVLPHHYNIGLGMHPLENRGEILACLEAFKQFLGA